MAVEGTRQRKLTELVADHVFIDIHRNVLTAVVHGDGQTDELRKNGGRRDQVLIGRLSRPA